MPVSLRNVIGLWLVLLATGCAHTGVGTTQSPQTIDQPPAPVASGDAAPACKDQAFRQFDFWIGKWDVLVADGRKAGDNVITLINDGCGLLESYRTASGYRGHSVNAYDAARGVWHQTWIDNGGLLLTIEGGMQSGSMVMTGTRKRTTSQGAVLDRISWTPADDGSVRQVWEVSADDGASWRPIFDGRYRRKP